MLALASALVLDPELLIIDEISLGLAPIVVESIFKVLERMHAEGKSLLLVEQNAQLALEAADEAYVVESGRIALHGPAKESPTTNALPVPTSRDSDLMPQRRQAVSLLRNAGDRATAWRPFCWYWGDAILVDGLLEADALGAASYLSHLADIFERWERQCPPNFDDALAPGRSAIDLVMRDVVDLAVGERVLGAVERLPVIENGIPLLQPHQPFERFGVCVDALYHVPATFAMAARWRDDRALLQRAIRTAMRTLEVLRADGGLAQWYDGGIHDGGIRANNGVAWSRGQGWALLGLLDLLEIADGEPAPAVEDAAAELFRQLADGQGEDGHWQTVLHHPPASYETSTAAFYIAAALHPRAKNLVQASENVLERAANAVLQSFDAAGTYQGTSADVLPSWDITTYEHPRVEPSPWAQGAGMVAGSVRR